ncbi:MAG: DUF3109 family protein [Bacteroidales bacterium]|jgi:hypothetical protein|nr:DUF3109 family protein [Bacteroidales bacterium]MCI2133637.1 DUF3109 family protein [Bacteroidales bacterium]
MSSNKEFGTIIQIGDILVSEDVVTEHFACDYSKCKGICCVIGDSGAPLEEAELDKIEENYESFSPLMSEKGRAQVARNSFFIIDRDNDIVTPIVDGSGECAYTTFDEAGNCFCSMEKCFFKGTCKFRKPQSCWLYPIRVTKLSSGGLALNVHHWGLCKDAYEKGKREGIRVYEFLREPLIAIFGEEFYSALSAAAIRLNAAS